MHKVLLLAGALMLLPMGAANAIPCPGGVSDTLSIDNGAETAIMCESSEPDTVTLAFSPPIFNLPLVVLADEQTTISPPAPNNLVTITGASDLVSADDTSISLTSDGDAGGLDTFANINLLVVLPETGGPQDLSQYFGFAANSGAVVVQSDTEPEPPALTLFLTGLGLMGLLLWRSKRNSAECPL
jgi:hypothetical protein